MSTDSSVMPSQTESSQNGTSDPTPSERFMIWVDGVGGYLVCADPLNSVGQSTQNNDVSIPICGDIHQLHARIESSESGHLIHPVGPVSISGQPITQAQLLVSNKTFQMGDSVSLRYSRPHPWSNSAVISFESRNRTHPWSDAVLIAGDTIILGPGSQTHVRCPRWEHEVILVRREGQWFCRSFAEFSIDGQVVDLEGELGPNSRVEGKDYSFSLESLASLAN